MSGSDGEWFDDPRMGRDLGRTKHGDERLTWDQALFARTGFAVWAVHVDGIGSGVEVADRSASDARRNLRHNWCAQTDRPWPGHKRCTLEYLEVHG